MLRLWQVNESTATNKTKRFGRISGQTLGAMNHSVENSTHVDSCLKIEVAWFYGTFMVIGFYQFTKMEEKKIRPIIIRCLCCLTFLRYL